MDAPGTLVYPEFNGLARVEDNKQEVLLTSKISDWTFNYADYRYVGAVTLSVDNRLDNEGDVIAAFADGECRGIAERMYFPFGDTYMYIVQVYSNVESGEELTFKYYDSSNDEVVEYTESIVFNNFMNVGDGFNTLGLSREVLSIPEVYSLGAAYPNPFNPVTNFNYTMPNDGMVQVSVYDVNGRIVADLVNGYMKAGTHPVVWNASELSSGIYMLQMISGDFTTMQKVMLIK